ARAENTLVGVRSREPWRWPSVNLVVRARGKAYRAPLTIQKAFANDGRFKVNGAGTFEQRDGTAVKRQNQRFVGALFSLFAALSLVLAALGVYGILSHAVAELRREIGVRLALGSS